MYMYIVYKGYISSYFLRGASVVVFGYLFIKIFLVMFRMSFHFRQTDLKFSGDLDFKIYRAVVS